MQHAKPQLSFWQIWNMCFGFLGLQFGFALQNANVSRIFETLGAGLEQVPLLWIAAPFTGLVVQPLIGYFSDRTWTRLGRRRPYFVGGALLAAAALVYMPRASNLWVAAALLWLLDGAINISMEPFRAFVGDQLPPVQRPAGYAMQSFFIGSGAVIASMLPWLLTRAGISNHGTGAGTGAGSIPDTVRYSFDIGAAVLLAAIGWTTLGSREYPPEQLLSFDDAKPAGATQVPNSQDAGGRGYTWAAVGVAGVAATAFWHLDPQLYLLGAGALLWGITQLVYARGVRAGMFGAIMEDLANMPLAMRRLAPVQFFSWLALFSMWIYTTAAVAQVHFDTTDPQSEAFDRGANWVGVLFAAYSGFAALAAVAIPSMVRRLGLRVTHLINLWAGGVGLLSFLMIRNPDWLLVSMVGVGFAWASIVSIPYALLSDSVPAAKMGLYMGVFNFFIVIPQLVAASLLGFLLRVLFGGAPIHAMVLGGIALICAGLLVLRVAEPASSH
jgi:maltose/moltooligosaccharide transporter